jgi:hypothetical protein
MQSSLRSNPPDGALRRLPWTPSTPGPGERLERPWRDSKPRVLPLNEPGTSRWRGSRIHLLHLMRMCPGRPVPAMRRGGNRTSRTSRRCQRTLLSREVPRHRGFSFHSRKTVESNHWPFEPSGFRGRRPATGTSPSGRPSRSAWESNPASKNPHHRLSRPARRHDRHAPGRKTEDSNLRRCRPDRLPTGTCASQICLPCDCSRGGSTENRTQRRLLIRQSRATSPSATASKGVIGAWYEGRESNPLIRLVGPAQRLAVPRVVRGPRLELGLSAPEADVLAARHYPLLVAGRGVAPRWLGL